MTSIAEDVATNLVQRLIDGAIREVNYFCCFKTHVGNFEKKNKLLVAKKEGVLKDIEDAKNRNETQVEGDVQLWLDETNKIIDEDTKTNMKCFHGCPNCIWQYKQGRKLAKKILDITDLIERCSNFNRVARLVQPPGIKYYSPQNFIDFDSRKSKFKKLVDLLQDENYYMIGLQGLGGTGKTTLAIKVGERVEESKAFQKVIFAVVSNPPDIGKIRQKIAGQLELQLEQGKEEVHSEFLWARIANYEGKVLIILDDIWEWLDLRCIGIPCGPNHKNCCVLVTTRDLKVCEVIGCQQTIILGTLNDEDALNLFIKQVDCTRSDYSSSEFKDLAQGIVKECGGTPLAIVAVATTIKGWSLQDWKNVLETLQNSNPLSNVHDELKDKVYISLKLSYDHLKEKAKCLLLLCSLFPEDYEIPIDLLSKLAIGLDCFREPENYFEARRKVVPVKNDLIKSSLLLEVDEYCVKMHDLVREVTLWITDENVQVIMDSSAALKPNLQFLFWSNDDFPNCFEATKLKILIICIEGEAKVRDVTIFEGMANLKVLFLEGPSLLRRERRNFTPLLQSLLSLENIRTLIFRGWELSDISILKNLKCLETFELEHCSITEFPKEISELEKLKLLSLRWCNIERNNPFEVIERCSQLEELYFVENDDVKDWKPAENINEVAQKICPPKLQRYSIACSGFKFFNDGDDDGLLNYFNTEHVGELISKSLFKDLIGRAKVLKFRETREAGWKSLIDGRMMNDLIKLCLCDLADIRCLIDRDMPDGSFRQLQSLKLRNCKNLQHLCFDGNLKLPHLKSLHLELCPMLQPSIFQLQSSVALCVEQLEELIINRCGELRSLITYESLGVGQQKSYGSPFQKLKSLQIDICDKLEWVSPLFSAGDLSLLKDLCIRDCKEMKYIFGEYRDEGQALHHDIILPSLTEIKLWEVPSFIGIFRECKICTQRLSCPILKDDSREKHRASSYGCCFLPTTKDIGIGVSNSSLQNLEATKESCASYKRLEKFLPAECFMKQPLSLQNIREMTLQKCLKLKSLFSVSTATTIMLEKLEISFCEELKHIITNEEEDDENLNCTSIFPNLQQLEVVCCDKLEFIFPSTLSIGLQNLQSINIDTARGLKYVFGAYNNDQNIDVAPINLPALERLSLKEVPEIISLCANNYYVVWPPLQHISLSDCWGLMKRTDSDFMASHQGRQQELETGKGLIRSLFPDFMICLQPRQPNMETSKDMKIIMEMQKLTSLDVWFSETIEEIFNVEGIQSEGPVTLSLQEMSLGYLGELRHIYKDPNNILSLLNLKVLTIIDCDKLKALFTTSTVKSLTQLSYLWVSGCEELVQIIEEDDYETSAYGRSHQQCFPMLKTIRIDGCHGLRSLFWISTTSTMLPNLETLDIKAASRLEEVFRCQQDDGTQEMLIQNVFPNLSHLRLKDMPELRTICRGIDFHSVPRFEVGGCPKYRGHKNISENESPKEELQATHSVTDQATSDMEEAKLEQETEAQELVTSASPNLTENFKEAMKDITEKVPVSKSAMELEDVRITRESTVQFQQWHLGETKISTNVPHKTNPPFDDDSIDAVLKERVQEGRISEDVVVATLLADLAPRNSPDLMKAESRRETIMTHQQELGEMTTCVVESFLEESAIMKTSIVTTSHSGTSELTYKETNNEVGKVVLSSKLSATTTSPDFEKLINGQPRTEQNVVDQLNSREATSEIKVPHQTNIAIMKGAVEQGFQERDGSKEAITPTNTNKGFHHILERGKEVAGSATNSTLAAASSNSESTEETRDANVQDGPKSEEAEMTNLLTYYYDIKSNIPMEDNTSLHDVIPSSHHKSRTGVVGSSSPVLEIGEILGLVELKDGEAALLAKALELYPQLRLPRGQRTCQVIAFSYRVLIDIFVMLATKTPHTITTSDKLTLEENLGTATFLAFDKEWIESVREKVFGNNMFDVTAVEEEIQAMKAELETCDITLEQVRNQRVKIKELIVGAINQLEMVQSEYEAIDSQLWNLLEDREKLIMKMMEFRGKLSAQDTPFGI